jgi:hypothetical protein
MLTAATPEMRSTLVFAGELLRLLGLFDRHAIPAVPFKGPVLADQLYGDISARSSCDLDILISKPDIWRTKAALLAAGYTTDLPDGPAETAYLNARYEIHFVSPGGIPIEIHQSFLLPAFCFPLVPRLETRRFFGRPVLALTPPDLLLVLCAHGAKHAWSQPLLIRDVARLLDIYSTIIDWPALLNRADALGARRMLLLGILLAAKHHDSVPPALFERPLADPAIGRLADRVQTGAAQSNRFFLATRERMRDKLGCCARLALLPNEQDHAHFRLPGSLAPLYYPLHAMRVLGKCLTSRSTYV